jgi:hypothetical protein
MQASRRRETRRSCLSFRDAPAGRRVAPTDDRLRIANKASGHLAIGDKKEIDKATWRKPRGIRLNTWPLVVSATSCSPSEAEHFRIWQILLQKSKIERPRKSRER